MQAKEAPVSPAFDTRGRVAVLTGAAGGMGAALADALADRGCHLHLVDLRQDGLQASAERARAKGVTVHTTCCDLADAASVRKVLAEVQAGHGRAAVLVNNAGVALGGRFEQVAAEDFDWLMRINFHAVVNLTRAFLPLLRAEPAAQVVNISSIFGIVAPPGQAAYCAAKFAVRGFSESLRHELETEGASVGLTLVHPGGVKTGIADAARLPAGVPADEVAARLALMRKALVMPPEQAAQRIVRAIERREPRVLVGQDAVGAALMQRLFPVGYWKRMSRVLARKLGVKELPR